LKKYAQCGENVSAEGVIQPEASYEGRAKEKVGTGEIYFVLLTENGLDVWPDRSFKLQGNGLNLSDKTDKNGEFKHSPAEFGDYELKVDDGVFHIPALEQGSLPYQVHVPYVLLPDQYQWDGPTEEELGGGEWDVPTEEELGD
jgi:hypothetical protein